MLSVIASQAVPGNSGVQLMARVVGWADALLTAGELATAWLTTADLTAEGQVPGSGVVIARELDPATIVLPDLVTNDPAWTMDSALAPGPDGRAGYNLAYLLPASDLTASGDTFQIELELVPAAAETYRILFSLPTWKVYG